MDERRTKARVALPPSPDFVSMREVAAYCCVSVAAVSQGVKRRSWPYRFLRRTWIGRRVLFTRVSFNHMAREMRASVEATASGIAPIEEGRKKSA